MKWGLNFIVLCLLAGCGSLRVNPKGCKTNAIFGANPRSSREITREELEEKVLEIKSDKTYYVFTDLEVSLRELLSVSGLKCKDIKKMRVKISSSWFFMRTVSLEVVKVN